jgi:probable HAF family extracellular repeat protein
MTDLRGDRPGRSPMSSRSTTRARSSAPTSHRTDSRTPSSIRRLRPARPRNARRHEQRAHGVSTTRGDVVGTALLSDGTTHAFLWTAAMGWRTVTALAG